MSLAFAACDAWARNDPYSVKEPVANTREEIRATDMAGLKQVPHRKDVVVVHGREPEEHETGHVPGAVNVPRGLLEFTVWGHAGFPNGLDMAKPTHRCRKARSRRTFAARTLQDPGFRNVTAVVTLWDDRVEAGEKRARRPQAPTPAP